MTRLKIAIAVVAALVLGIAATAYSRMVSGRAQTAAPATGQLNVAEPGRLLFTLADGADRGRVASVPAADPGAIPSLTDLRCERFHTAGGTAVCLTSVPGLVPTVRAIVTDHNGTEIARAASAGTASRARVSPSGRMVAWTTFVTGDSYATTGFSTRTALLDLSTGRLVVNMETIQLYLDGRRHHTPDVNYWGVTFTRDDNRFYATVATGGRTHLIEGDLANWRAENRRQNVECPSLSPDGTRIAFKLRVSTGDRPWRLGVLDLATQRVTELPGTERIDDQALWLDDHTVAYGLDGSLWTVPADGSAAPRLLAANALERPPVGDGGDVG